MVRSECCRPTVGGFRFNPPIAAIWLESWKYLCIAGGVYVLIYPWKWLLITNSYDFAFMVIDAEFQSFVRFRCQYNWLGPFGLSRLDDISCHCVVDLRSFEVTRFGPARYCTECIGPISNDSRSTPYLTVDNGPKYRSRMLAKGSSMAIN